MRETDDPSSSHNDEDDEYTDKFAAGRPPVVLPGPHDVLLGRGGGTNNHTGNIKFRQMVGEHKVQYFAASKVQKPQVARLVVKKWRELDPPGRFLIRKDEPKKNSPSTSGARNASNEGVWYEVGDKKAREKASQCLRERTAEVLPYIKQIRQEQDALTEQGVMTFQESVERHKKQEAQRMMAAQAQVAAHASQEAVPVTPSSTASASELDLSFSGGSGHTGTSTRGDAPHRYTSVPVPSFSRRTSCPTMAGPPPPASLHSSSAHRRASLATTVVPEMHPMHSTSMGGPGPYEYGLHDQDFYYSESNLDYHASLMEMQRQMEIQEMQMQAMQERMRVQQHQLRQHQMMQLQSTADPAAGGSPVADPHVATVSPEASLPGDGEEDFAEYDPLPIDSDDALLMVIPVNASSPNETSVPLSRSTHKTKRARDEGFGKENSDHSTKSRANADGELATTAATAAATLTAGKDEGEVRPDLATSSGHVKTKESVTTALTQALQADGEVTIEEYRRQLEAYMFNNHLGEPASAGHYNHDSDDGVHSDLDDEGDEPKHQNRSRATPRRHASRRGSRGVDRTVSGCSFMSTDTHLSANLSIFSNMSLLSENPPSCGARERKMNMARSLSSNLSLMSDVTDISNALDDLCL